MSWIDLDGRNILVIGAGGLGAGITASLAAAGARVALVDRSEDRIGQVIADTGESADVTGFAADLGTADECRRVVNAAATHLRGLDGFVHAVGLNDRRPILELDDDDWQRLMTTNLSTAFWTGQETGRIMCAAGHGRLVFISSVAGLLAHADHSIYAASKAGMNQLAKSMAREWSASGVEANVVAPGYVETDLTRSHLAKEGVRAGLESLVPGGRLGTPEQVANARLTFSPQDRIPS
jgi:gluconate 5-dehydrogenase